MAKETKAVMPIPEDWDGETWKCWVVEWPDSITWLAYLNGLISTPTKGRWWDSRTGSVIDAQAIGVEIRDRNHPLEEVLMSCNEETLALLERIAIAQETIAAKDCCQTSIGGGSAGAGLDDAPPSEQSTDAGAREGDPPPGFETWEEYDTYRCDMAYHIVNQIKADIATAGLLAAGASGVTGLGAALIAALFTPIGWAIMIGLAGVAIGWFVSGASISLITSFIEGKKDELVCAILLGTDVPSSIGSFADSVDTLVSEDAGITTYSPIAEYLAKDYIKKFATVDSFNRLYVKVAYGIETGNSCNCGSNCTPNIVWDQGILTGSGDLTPDDEIRTLTSTLHTNGTHYIQFRDDSSPCCNFAYEIISVSRPLQYTICNQCDETEVQPNGAAATVGQISAVYYLGFAAQTAQNTVFSMEIRLGPYVP